MQGLLGQYDHGITGLDPLVLPAPPLYLSQLVTPTATLVAYVTVEAFLLALGNETVAAVEEPEPEVPTFVLLEGGDGVLLEDGTSKLLLE